VDDDTGTAARDSGGGDTSVARSASLPYGERVRLCQLSISYHAHVDNRSPHPAATDCTLLLPKLISIFILIRSGSCSYISNFNFISEIIIFF